MKAQLERVLEILRAFAAERSDDKHTIQADTKLLREGVIDSFALVDLIIELEKQLGAPIPDGALIPEDFETPRVLTARLEKI